MFIKCSVLNRYRDIDDITLQWTSKRLAELAGIHGIFIHQQHNVISRHESKVAARYFSLVLNITILATWSHTL